MATNPQYAATPVNGAALLGTAETSLTAPTTTSTILGTSTNGTKIEQIRVMPIATTVAGLVYVFLHDGSTYHLFDEFSIPIATVSTSLPATPLDKFYDNLVILAAWSLRCSQSIAGNASLLKCHAFGGSF